MTVFGMCRPKQHRAVPSGAFWGCAARRRSWAWGLFACAFLGLQAGCHRSLPMDPARPSGKEGESGTRLITVGGEQGVELGLDSLRLADVATAPVQVKSLGASMEPVGEVAPTDSGTIQITSRLPGRITAVYASVGQRVHKGQILAQIDSVDLAQAEGSYQTALAHERLTYNQLLQQRKLAKFGAIDEPAVEDARRTFAAAQAAVKSDEAQIATDRVALQNTRKLVDLGEITRKPVDDARNAWSQAQAALVQARVNLHSTKASLDRVRILYRNGIYSKQQLEDAETAYNNAVASVQQSETAEKLTADELKRQEEIYKQNLNGASAVQAALSKLQQDQHTYRNDLTALELARRALKRAVTVRKSGIPVSQALQQAEDAYEEAKVAVEAAANTLRLYGVAPGAGAVQLVNGRAIIPITAPLEGIITQRNMVVGQVTDTSTPLLKIVNLDRVYVDAQVYEKDLTEVVLGSPVSIRVSAYPGRVFRGSVSYIGKEVNPDTRTLTVRTIISNPGWLLRPGMFASVRIGAGMKIGRPAVPDEAVFQENNARIVYVQVSDRSFVKRVVEVGPAVNGWTPVYKGLRPGEKVVVRGGLFLEAEQNKLQNERRGAA